MQLSTGRHIPISIVLSCNVLRHLSVSNWDSNNRYKLLRVPFYLIAEICQIKIKPALLIQDNHQIYLYHGWSLNFSKTSTTLNETKYSWIVIIPLNQIRLQLLSILQPSYIIFIWFFWLVIYPEGLELTHLSK